MKLRVTLPCTSVLLDGSWIDDGELEEMRTRFQQTSKYPDWVWEVLEEN